MKKRRKGEPTSLRQLVPGVLRGLRGPTRGPVVRVRVEVASAAVRHDLATFRHAEVLKGLQERLPELRIREVSYRLGKPS